MNYAKLNEQLEVEDDLVRGARADGPLKGELQAEAEQKDKGDTDEESECEDEEDNDHHDDDDDETENHDDEEQTERAPSIPIQYDAKYNAEGVIALFDAIAPFWQKDASDVPDLHPEKLFETLRNIVDEWRQLKEFGKADKNLQALLCLATSLDWFSQAQITELDTWAGEVASCRESNRKDWTSKFLEEELRIVVRLRFGADVSSIKVETNSTISIEYIGGDFGDGTHNGRIFLDCQALRIHDHREDGKVLWWMGRFPADANDLGECLLRSCWQTTWDTWWRRINTVLGVPSDECEWWRQRDSRVRQTEKSRQRQKDELA
eukprot:TRINITY_DN19063_c0_g1_i1.p1 TRINITY_DN19063_c0_g1~~TRINITY_DN19063_c0_g1_i1.p1  ORF type:complete len:320 (-),score=76.59 TRINITY_DN19063_c0_g1_i1:3-962(-)